MFRARRATQPSATWRRPAGHATHFVTHCSILPRPGWQKKYIMQLTVDDVFLAYHRRLSIGILVKTFLSRARELWKAIEVS